MARASGFDSFMGGFTAVRDLVKEERGYAAAREQYGEKANAPELFGKLQEQDLAVKRDKRADQQMAIQAQAAARAERADGRAAETHDFSMADNRSSRNEQGMLNLVNGLRQARDQDQDLGEAFDMLVDTLPKFGVDPDDIPAMRQELLENPAILDQYYEALSKPVTTRNGRTAAGTKVMSGDERAEIEGELLKFDDVFARIDKLQDPDRQVAARSILGMFGPGKAMSGGFGQYGAFPGSEAAGYVSDLEALAEGDVRSIAFETLKGGGQITQVESEFARDALLRLKRSTSYEHYQRELSDFRAYMEKLRDAARRRLDGESVPPLKYNEVETKRGTGNDESYTRSNGTDVNTIYPGFVDPDSGDKFLGGDPGDPASWETNSGE